MNHALTYLFWLTLAWLAYFVLHSLLASIAVKNAFARRWPGSMRNYRLAFNFIAVVALILPLGLMWGWSGPLIIHWSGAWKVLSDLLSLGALLLFVYSFSFYDLREFTGLRQRQEKRTSVKDQERLHLSPLHRYVRHPWYFLGLILIWTRDMHAAQLLSTLLLTAYLFYGARLEEEKLLLYHGERYRRYMAKVGGLLPRPGRILSVEEARELGGGME